MKASTTLNQTEVISLLCIVEQNRTRSHAGQLGIHRLDLSSNSTTRLSVNITSLLEQASVLSSDIANTIEDLHAATLMSRRAQTYNA